MPVVFYRTRMGSEVVRNWLRDLAEMDRNAIGQDLMRVQVSLAGWECRCAAQWATVYGKYDLTLPAIALRV